jgi:LPS O-antigen subunit length determinant protein (WzzB/FepE family)
MTKVNSGPEPGLPDIPPAGYFLVVPPSDRDQGQVDLAEVLRTALRGWRKVLGSAVVGAAVAALVSLLMPSVYRAQVLVAPVQQGGSSAASLLQGQVGGLAALAGIDLGGAGDSRKEAFARLASAGFARDFIVTNELLPDLFPERWDAESGKWRPGVDVPSTADGVRRFTREVRSVAEDRKTGLVTLTVDWYEPELAERWANGSIDLANERLRVDAIAKSEQSIAFLNNELRKTDVLELRQAINRLIVAQLNNAMLASVQKDYAFRVVDAAVVPDRRFRPRRSVITVVGGLIGGVVGLLWIFAPGWIRASNVIPEAKPVDH